MGDDLRARFSVPFQLAEVHVDPACLRIAGPRGSRRLEPRVMDVLVALAARAPDPVSRDELIDAVWGAVAVTDGVLSRCISILRDLLGDDRARPRYIETLSKKGYRLLAPVSYVDAAHPARGVADAPLRAGTARSIAVLPFVNLAAGEDDEHVADGLTELTIANLASVASLRVIARTSSMIYKHARKRVRDIAAELGVDYVVEGSVRGDGHRIQVVAQLIEARSELHAWAQTYTRSLSDLLALLSEIALAVAEAVSAQVGPAAAARLVRHRAMREPALRHYLTGRHFWAQRGPDALRKAGEEFAACALEAPDFAPAHCGLADGQILLALYGIEHPLRAAALAREHHARAFALDPESAEVQTAQGAIRMFFDWDLDAAEPAFLRALAGNPSYTTALLALGDLLMMRGESGRALATIVEAVALSPFDLGLGMNHGDFLLFSGRFEEAARQFERTLTKDERFVPSRLRLAEALALAGDGDGAHAQAARAASVAPAHPHVRVTQAFVLAATGRKDEARRELAALAAQRSHRYVSAWEIARGHAVMRDADAAFAWLAAAIDERAPMTLFAGVHPALDPIRGDPRFAGVLAAVGIRAR